MSYMGEFTKNSLIFLELLTKDEQDQWIEPDSVPQATIYWCHQDGVTRVAHVTLDIVTTGLYTRPFQIPEQLAPGFYVIIYEAIIDGEFYKTYDYFRLVDKTVSWVDQLIEHLDNQFLQKDLKIEVSSENMLTENGEPTRVYYFNRPLANALVRIVNADTHHVVAQARTDAQGTWSALVYPGTYRIEFVHPNGQLLRQLVREVI